MFFHEHIIATWTIPSIDGSFGLTPAGKYVLCGGTPIDRNFTISNVKFWGNSVLTDSSMFTEILRTPSNYFEWRFQNSLNSVSNMSGTIQYSRGSNIYNFEYDYYLNKTVLVSNSVNFSEISRVIFFSDCV